MSWQPHATLEVAQARATMLQQAREFFARRDVLEVETPALSQRATMDPNIASVRASLSNKSAFLSTSPEYHMKRLLAAGFADIYQICRVFRDGESGRHHLPEFTMAEWYRLGFGLNEMIDESVRFIALGLGDKHIGREPVLVSYVQAFEQSLGLDPLTASLEAIIIATNADADLREALGNDRDAWLDLAMAQCVCAAFAADRQTVVYHYPISQAALARQCIDNPELADRFEIFYGQLELANGFVELTDATTQKMRFQVDQRARKAQGLPTHAIDENLIDALSSGLPQCAGVAVGFDRLLMLREKLSHIDESVTFSPGE